MIDAFQWIVFIALVATSVLTRETWDAVAVVSAAVLGLQLGAATQRWLDRGDA
jgi:hypothetical protein